MAEKVFIIANSNPSSAVVKINISGSIIGDAIQKANTGAIGTPAAKRPATKGITPQEHRGIGIPINVAFIIFTNPLPDKLFFIENIW